MDIYEEKANTNQVRTSENLVSANSPKQEVHLRLSKGQGVKGYHNCGEVKGSANSPKVKVKEFDTRDKVLEWIILNQFGRRNLSAYQRSVLALRLKPIYEAKAKVNQVLAGGDRKSDNAKPLRPNSDEANTDKNLSKIAGVGHDTIARVQKNRQQC